MTDARKAAEQWADLVAHLEADDEEEPDEVPGYRTVGGVFLRPFPNREV